MTSSIHAAWIDWAGNRSYDPNAMRYSTNRATTTEPRRVCRLTAVEIIMAEDRTSTASNKDAHSVAPAMLPDFCSGETILRVFILVMVLALVVLLLTDPGPDPMVALYPIAMFITWVAFSSLLLLCLLQRWLHPLPMVWQVVIPTAIPVINTALVHWGAEQVFLADGDARLSVIAAAAGPAESGRATAAAARSMKWRRVIEGNCLRARCDRGTLVASENLAAS